MGQRFAIQVTVKEYDKKMYYAMGDKDMNRIFLNEEDIKTRCESLQSWFPSPNIVLCYMLEDVLENSQEIKKEATRLMKMFLTNKQSIGVGECLLWHVKVKVDSLCMKTRESLNRGGCYLTWVSLNDLVKWEDMKNARTVAQGPGDKHYQFHAVSWLLVLRVFLQIVDQLARRVADSDCEEAGAATAGVPQAGEDRQGEEVDTVSIFVEESASVSEPDKAVKIEVDTVRDNSDSDDDFISPTPQKNHKRPQVETENPLKVKRLMAELPDEPHIRNLEQQKPNDFTSFTYLAWKEFHYARETRSVT